MASAILRSFAVCAAQDDEPVRDRLKPTLRLLIAAALLLSPACGGRRARDNGAAMQQDLAEIRKAIRDYRTDKGRLPRTLDELVQAHYLHMLPLDPVTGKADWRTITEEPVRVDEFQQTTAPPPDSGGIVDVRSAAAGTDVNGRPWSEY